MARPRRRSDVGVTLFPFLNVLACAMGVLIVAIAGQNFLAIGMSDQVIEISGSEQERKAVYVECDRKGVLIHPEGTRVSLATLEKLKEEGNDRPAPPMPASDPEASPQEWAAYRARLAELFPCPFARLLAELKASGGKRYLVLLIRPRGIDTFELCQRLARKRRLKVGKDALLGGGKLVFTNTNQATVQSAGKGRP